MKTLSKLTAIILIVSLSGLLYTCEKNHEHGESELEFIVDEKTSEALSLLKNAEGHSFSDVCKVVITIKHADGSDTKYNSYELNAYNLNGTLNVQRISLKTGDYRLTEFLLVDSSNSILFAAPLQGSPGAILSPKPLPSDFTISLNQVEQVKVFVLTTEGLSLEDFGLARFNVEEAETIKFRIGLLDSIQDIFVSATLWVWAHNIEMGEYDHSFQVSGDADNLIEIRDGYDNYTLNFRNFENYNYDIIQFDLTNAELKALADSLDNEPWIITLYNSEPEILMDAEGNEYRTVTICGKTWIAENLKTGIFDDYTPIPLSGNSGSNVSCDDNLSMARLKYGDDPDVYGYYYNWYAVNSGKLAPAGWHVATIDEWSELLQCSEGEGVLGGKLKEKGFEHWKEPNTGATNTSGFTALPGNYFKGEGGNYGIGEAAYFWTTTPAISGGSEAYCGCLKYNSTGSEPYLMPKDYFLSVRLVKDY